MRPSVAACLALAALALAGCVGSGQPPVVEFHVGTAADGTFFVQPAEASVRAGFAVVRVVDDAAEPYAVHQPGSVHDLLLTYHGGAHEETSWGRRCFTEAQPGEPAEPRSQQRFYLRDTPSAEDRLCLRAGADGSGGTYALSCRLPGHSERATLRVLP